MSLLKSIEEKLRIFVLYLKRKIMPVNGTYDNEYPIDGLDLITGARSEDGKTVQYTVNNLAEFIQTNGTGKLAIYDGATDVSPYLETFNVGDIHELRLGFSGPKTNETWFPTSYGTLMVNQFSAPAGSSFDFRYLPAGQYLSFEVEFQMFIKNSGNATITPNVDYNMVIEAQFPNGDSDTRTFKLPSSSSISNTLLTNAYKFEFTTLINDVLTDSLLGGKILIASLDGSTTDVITIAALKVTAKI